MKDNLSLRIPYFACGDFRIRGDRFTGIQRVGAGTNGHLLVRLDNGRDVVLHGTPMVAFMKSWPAIEAQAWTQGLPAGKPVALATHNRKPVGKRTAKPVAKVAAAHPIAKAAGTAS